MRWKPISLLTVWALLAAGPALAGAIYTWTDADGVKRFSNSQPPEDAENVQIIDELKTDPSSDDHVRPEYQRMVEDAGRDADRHFEEQAQQKARQAEIEQRRAEAMQADRVAAEQEKLQKAIAEIQSRGLSPTFSPGQKAAMIQKIQEKIDRLNTDPDGYFKK